MAPSLKQRPPIIARAAKWFIFYLVLSFFYLHLLGDSTTSVQVSCSFGEPSKEVFTCFLAPAHGEREGSIDLTIKELSLRLWSNLKWSLLNRPKTLLSSYYFQFQFVEVKCLSVIMGNVYINILFVIWTRTVWIRLMNKTANWKVQGVSKNT